MFVEYEINDINHREFIIFLHSWVLLIINFVLRYITRILITYTLLYIWEKEKNPFFLTVNVGFRSNRYLQSAQTCNLKQIEAISRAISRRFPLIQLRSYETQAGAICYCKSRKGGSLEVDFLSAQSVWRRSVWQSFNPLNADWEKTFPPYCIKEVAPWWIHFVCARKFMIMNIKTIEGDCEIFTRIFGSIYHQREFG